LKLKLSNNYHNLNEHSVLLNVNYKLPAQITKKIIQYN